MQFVQLIYHYTFIVPKEEASSSEESTIASRFDILLIVATLFLEGTSVFFVPFY
jgi:hypothetical protein